MELVLWLSLIIMHISWCNKICNGLLECGSWFAGDYVYELWLFHTFMNVSMMTQDWVRPVKEQAGTELNLKLNTHSETLVATPKTLPWIFDVTMQSSS